MIPFLNLKAINQQYQKELKKACSRVIDSGWYLMGKELESFDVNLLRPINHPVVLMCLELKKKVILSVNKGP